MRSTTATARTCRTLLLIAAVAGALAACSPASPAVSASTTCSDFLQMDSQTQSTGVQTLAARTHGSAFRGPMGLANVVYDCEETPHKTLGALMGVR